MTFVSALFGLRAPHNNNKSKGGFGHVFVLVSIHEFLFVLFKARSSALQQLRLVLIWFERC